MRGVRGDVPAQPAPHRETLGGEDVRLPRVELPKPTITLCGSGNTGGCHGKAHAHKLHFRWVETDVKDKSNGFWFATIRGGHWEVLETDEPMREFEALQVEDGWRPLRGQEG